MNLLAPLGPVYQAGTLSGNPLAMAAGIATLRYLSGHEAEVYAGLDKRTAAVADGIAAAARDAGIAMETNRAGSMVTWFLTIGKVTDFASAAKSDTEAFGRFHRAMLDQGVWLPPSQFEAAFLSTAHTAEDIDFTVDAARRAFASMHAAMGRREDLQDSVSTTDPGAPYLARFSRDVGYTNLTLCLQGRIDI